jgi:ATP-dependent RNA helicase DeaD
VFSKNFSEHEDLFEFDDSLILIYQLHKRRIGTPIASVPIERSCIYYKDRHDLVEQKLSSRDDDYSRRDRDVKRQRQRSRQRREKRQRAWWKTKKKDENMVRFFFNLGKKDHLKNLMF